MSLYEDSFGRLTSYQIGLLIRLGIPMSDQLPLNNVPDFDGKTFNREHDKSRLATQLLAVKMVMLDGVWRSPKEIAKAAEIGHGAGITARIRDLRKTKFGGYVIQVRRRHPVNSGIFEYRLLKPTDPEAIEIQTGKSALKSATVRTYHRACLHCGKVHRCFQPIQPELELDKNA